MQALVDADPSLGGAARAGPPLPASRGGARRPPRDGDDHRRRAGPAHPRPVAGAGRVGRRRRRRRRAPRRRARMERRGDRSTGRGLRRPRRGRAGGAGPPHDRRLRRSPRDGPARAAGSRARRPHPAHRAPRRRGRRHRSPRPPRSVPVPDARHRPPVVDLPHHHRRRRARRGQPRLVAPRHDLGARRAGARTGRRGRVAHLRRGGRRGAGGVQRGRHPRHRGGGPQRRVRSLGARCTAGSCSTSAGSRGSPTWTPPRWCSTSRPGPSATTSSTSSAPRARRHPRSLAPVRGALHGRRLAGVPFGRPALHPLREDRGHGAGPRRRPRRRPAHHHGRGAAGGGRVQT